MHVLRLEDFMNGDHTWFERTFRYAVYGSCEPVRRPKGRKKRRGGEGRREKKRMDGRKERRTSKQKEREKKRWNSVVYPVIYNWKLGTTTRPKAIRRFHSGESSPFSVLAKVVRPSTIVDPPFLRVFSFVPLQTRIRLSYVVRALFPSPVANRLEFDTAQRHHRSIREINIHGTDGKKSLVRCCGRGPSEDSGATDPRFLRVWKCRRACARLFGFSSSAS